MSINSTTCWKSSASSQEPIQVEPGEPSVEPGEPIPPRTAARDPGDFTLDEGVLKRLMAETQQVAIMLGEAMRDEGSD